MRTPIVLTAVILVGSLFATPVYAQDDGEATRSVENLHAQLNDVRYREADLKIQLEELQFDLKPENIERFYAGYGSTRPEELRESRRRQLQGKKDQVNAELEQLAATRARLENAISNAEIYRQSAMGTLALQRDRNRNTQWVTFSRVLAVGLVLTVILGSLLWRRVIKDRLDG